MFRFILPVVSCSALALGAALPPEQMEFFEKKIRPVLASECAECHGAAKQKGGLRLDFRDGWKAGGDSGTAIVPGDPAKSLLLKSVRHEDPDLAMPAKRPKLSDAVIADFEKWIAMGAPDPRDVPAKEVAAVDWATLLEDRKKWWSLQPVQPVQPPPVRAAAWPNSRVDQFLLAKMESAGLAPGLDAAPEILCRRVTFALTGLPPSAAEVDAFVAAYTQAKRAPDAQSATQKVVGDLADRLLAAPSFGERWGRHWLDLVRYAETHGSEGDPEIPQVWRYRDYVIRAFNDDVPIDQLIREHVAGDLLATQRLSRDGTWSESKIGPAHFRLVEHGFQPVDTRDEQVKVVESQIDVLSKAFQAMTFACARCHDHKFDAISQRDYYALAGIFESSRPAMVTIDNPQTSAAARAPLADLKGEIKDRLATAWMEAARRFPAQLQNAAQSAAQIAEARRKVEALETQLGQTEANLELARRGGKPPMPVSRWTFNRDARDTLGKLHGETKNGAAVKNGRLVLDGRDAFVQTAPLGRELRAKTLEAWVALPNLAQGGGGVISLEDESGVTFDSIVFAEKEPRKWVVGSNQFCRSEVSAGPEEATTGALVHVAAVYYPDHTVALFRNGQPYGKPWKSGQPMVAFDARAHLLFGYRHTRGGRAALTGEIDEARLYDRALTAEEITASYRTGPSAPIGEALPLRPATAEEIAVRDQLAQALAVSRAELAKVQVEDSLGTLLREAEKDPASPLQPWFARDRQEPLPGPGTVANPPARQSYPIRYLSGSAFEKWPLQATGDGFPKPVGGEFMVLPEGPQILGGLTPAGFFTASLSRKLGGIAATPRFLVEQDFLSFRVWGGGGATVRLIVDGYPLGSNGIFPQAVVKSDEPTWVRLDVRYRRGSMVYLEFATAADLTRQDGNANRTQSWFGVSEVVAHGDKDGPENPRPAWRALLGDTPVRDANALAQRYGAVLAESAAAWRAGTLDEPRRQFLDYFIRRGLLPTTREQLPNVASLVRDFRGVEITLPAPLRVPGVVEADSYDAAFLPRGEHLKPGPSVPRGYPSVLGSGPFSTAQTGRLELAAALTDPRNPLTARVMVNRVWLQLFGRGLVATPDSFGKMGELPSHPELLDELAARFVADGWSAKKLIRQLVLTHAYQLASEPPAAVRERDPENILLTHFRLRRLEAEPLRDSLLALSGELDPVMFGPSAGANAARRSIYLGVRRTNLQPFLTTFDAPKPFTTMGRRDATNVPAQSLTLLNDPFVVGCAERWAAKLLRQPHADPAARIKAMFKSAFARSPSPAELTATVGFLETLCAGRNGPVMADQAAWRDLAQSMFNLKEFAYVR